MKTQELEQHEVLLDTITQMSPSFMFPSLTSGAGEASPLERVCVKDSLCRAEGTSHTDHIGLTLESTETDHKRQVILSQD